MASRSSQSPAHRPSDGSSVLRRLLGRSAIIFLLASPFLDTSCSEGSEITINFRNGGGSSDADAGSDGDAPSCLEINPDSTKLVDEHCAPNQGACVLIQPDQPVYTDCNTTCVFGVDKKDCEPRYVCSDFSPEKNIYVSVYDCKPKDIADAGSSDASCNQADSGDSGCADSGSSDASIDAEQADSEADASDSGSN